MKQVLIIGTGFVADLYMRSLELYDDIAVRSVYDWDPKRLEQFSKYWNVPAAKSLEELIGQGGADDIILNLTNPASHFDVTHACLTAGRHVYTEKPLALNMNEARTLYEIAKANGLLLISAPCSVLGESFQTLLQALREKKIGQPLLVYAELDDGFVSKAPYKKWKSLSGANWPFVDEFQVGCTIEHAGYYISWLVALFGPVRKVIAASAEIDVGKLVGEKTAPDFSVGILFFDHGIVARLTCSIIAKHNHSIRIFGVDGTLEVDECWNNYSAVRLRQRLTLRRRLIELPFTRRIRANGETQARVKRYGSAAMDFALGPAEMLSAIKERRPCHLSAEFALHVNEVTLAIHSAGANKDEIIITTECAKM